jgi:DNA polymerase-3 subunit alpha
MSDFIHCHCHSDYSLYDGFQTVPEMVAKAKELNFKAIALTDHGKVGGFIKLQKACKAAKDKDIKEGKEYLAREIKPILGIEAYVVDNLADSKSHRYHQTIWAKNNKGLENIYKLASLAEANTVRRFPRMDFNMLKEHSEGLMLASGCIVGKFADLIVKENVPEAEKVAKQYKDVWGDDFYIETMWTGYEPQKLVMKHGVEIAKRLGIKVISSNDVHYSEKKSGESQRVKISISRNGPLENNEYRDHQMYMKTYEEMLQTFGEGRKEYLHNTMEIYDKAEAKIVLGQAKLPIFEIPEDDEVYNKYKKTFHESTPESEIYLRYLAENGLKKKNLWDNSIYRERLYKELETIKFTGFETYFIILNDFMSYAKSIGVSRGIGRGSAPGSLVLYCLDVTGIDPIKYNLSMERFLFSSADYRARISDFFESVDTNLEDDIKKLEFIKKDETTKLDLIEESC